MRRTFTMIGLISLTAMLWGAVPVAYAAESDAYSLTDDAGRAAAMHGDSSDYQLSGNIMWYTTGESDAYQVNVFPVGASSSVSAGAASSAAAAAGDDRGGHRGEGTNTSRVSSQRSSASSLVAVSRRSRPVTSSRASDAMRPAADAPSSITAPHFSTHHQSLVGLALPVTQYGRTSTIHFFGAVEPVCEPCIQRQCVSNAPADASMHGAAPWATQHRVMLVVMIVGFVIAVYGGMLLGSVRRVRMWPFVLDTYTYNAVGSAKHHQKKRAQRKHGKRGLSALIILVMLASFARAEVAVAEDTVPQYRIYNGQLRTAAGQPITTPHTIRFSYWNTSDMVAGDLTGTGSINGAATTYLGWQEFHTVTPNAQGNFYVQLGSVSPLGNVENLTAQQAMSLYLQVDVKADGAAFSAFQTLDVNRNSDTIDRTPVNAVPSARNADLLDLREVGTGSGSIPYLLSGGLLPVSTVPGGTNRDSFVIDSNNSATAEVALQFGSTLSEKLSFDIANDRFVFSDDLRVEGNLTVTGLINGVDITSLSEATATHLKVSSGAGLNVDVAGGNYQISGNTTNYAGSSGVGVANNATSYIFFGSGGLTVRQMSFPTDESFIPLAEVVTSGGSIQSVTDRRVLQSDNRENTILKAYNASFENASYQGDGLENVGQLSVSHDNLNLKNFYVWTTTRTSLQDYDIIQRVSLPAGFVRWDTSGGMNPLTVTYRTTSADTTNAKLDIQVYDTNGVPVTLSGSVTDLASTSWATTQIEFAGNPTWTPGMEFLIRFKMSAKDNYQVQIGDFKTRFVELLGDH